VLYGVAFVLKLCSFGNEAFTAFLTAALDQVATCFCLHPGAKTVLASAGPLGRLISPFHRFVFLRKFFITLPEPIPGLRAMNLMDEGEMSISYFGYDRPKI
jgi:hypothetical protein